MHAGEDEVLSNLAAVREGIADAADRAGRDPSDVLMVAAAKTVRPEAIRWVAAGGVTAIGENYVQELRAARSKVEDGALRWHYIGTLGSGTAHQVADLADVVETVSGERGVRRLAGRAARSSRTLDVLIEVDLTERRTGVHEEGLRPFCELVTSLEGVRLRGLMTLPPLPAVPEDSRSWFVRLRGLRDRIRDEHPGVLELSMGMSLDYAVAVEEGATMVRIGTALFGSRAA